MDYKVIDNFLNEDEFLQLENLMYNPNLNLYFQDRVAGDSLIWSPFLGHKIYDRGVPMSDLYYLIKDIFLSKLDMKSLIRSKLNCYLKTENLIEHDLHFDYEFPHKGSILSLNTCDGFTILEDGTRIESKRNRLILFDSSKLHKSTSCTSTPSRWNIIANYF